MIVKAVSEIQFYYYVSNDSGGVDPVAYPFVKFGVRIRVQFRNQEFEQMDLDEIPTPLFSYLSPYGVQQVSMEAVR